MLAKVLYHWFELSKMLENLISSRDNNTLKWSVFLSQEMLGFIQKTNIWFLTKQSLDIVQDTKWYFTLFLSLTNTMTMDLRP